MHRASGTKCVGFRRCDLLGCWEQQTEAGPVENVGRWGLFLGLHPAVSGNRPKATCHESQRIRPNAVWFASPALRTSGTLTAQPPKLEGLTKPPRARRLVPGSVAPERGCGGTQPQHTETLRPHLRRFRARQCNITTYYSLSKS